MQRWNGYVLSLPDQIRLEKCAGYNSRQVIRTMCISIHRLVIDGVRWNINANLALKVCSTLGGNRLKHSFHATFSWTYLIAYLRVSHSGSAEQRRSLMFRFHRGDRQSCNRIRALYWNQQTLLSNMVARTKRTAHRDRSLKNQAVLKSLPSNADAHPQDAHLLH